MQMQTNILLVEDDASLNTVLADYLRSKEYIVETAGNGKEAWDLIMTKHYDLILTDITMPKMNGFELLKLIRSKYSNLPVVMLTARTDRDDTIQAYQLGCDDYVNKPFSMDILICKIEAILRRCRINELSTQTEWQLGEKRFDSVRQLIGEQHLSSRGAFTRRLQADGLHPQRNTSREHHQLSQEAHQRINRYRKPLPRASQQHNDIF
jgi:DNA-binding response OmpR family regulator